MRVLSQNSMYLCTIFRIDNVRKETDIPTHTEKTNTDNLEVFGARVHNLKNINLKIPRNKLVVITGLSGSGKSSLAFDTIYAEGQRRYMETFRLTQGSLSETLSARMWIKFRD